MCEALENIYNFFGNYFFKINIAEVGTIIGVILAVISIWQIKKINEEESNPFVSLFLDKDSEHKEIVYLKLKNFGKTPAFNIIIPKLITPKNVNVEIAFPQKIPFLAPNQEVVSIYCFGVNIKEFTIQNGIIEYHNEKKNKLSTEYVLDVTTFKGNTYTDSSIEKISKNTEKIYKNFERLIKNMEKQPSVDNNDVNEKMKKLWDYIEKESRK